MSCLPCEYIFHAPNLSPLQHHQGYLPEEYVQEELHPPQVCGATCSGELGQHRLFYNFDIKFNHNSLYFMVILRQYFKYYSLKTMVAQQTAGNVPLNFSKAIKNPFVLGTNKCFKGGRPDFMANSTEAACLAAVYLVPSAKRCSQWV